MNRIAIICVSYKSDQVCQKFVENILSLQDSDKVDIYLVDNAADESALLGFFKNQKQVRVISEKLNLGYFGGARRALQELSGKRYDWIIVSNVDISVQDVDFFSRLWEVNSQGVGVLAPEILSGISKKDSNPFMTVRPSKGRMSFYRWIFASYVLSQLYHLLSLGKDYLRSVCKGSVQKVSHDIYAPHGAFMIFSGEYFEKGGTLEHGTFMYGEEISVAENCRKISLPVVYRPDLRVIHQERVSTGKLYSRRVLSWKKNSSHYLLETYFR